MSEKEKNNPEGKKNRPAGGNYGKPGTKSAGGSYGRPGAKGAGKSYGKPGEKGTGKNYGKPAGKSFGKPGEKGTGKTFGKPAGKSFGKPGERPAGRSFGRPAGERRGPYGRPAPKKEAAPMEGLAARRLALKVLREVTEQGAYASLSLDRALQGCGLIAADRRLVSRLVYDTLDRMIYLDYVLSQVMAKEDTDIKLRNILRLGACQILVEDRIPESAATNTSVALCAELGMEGLKGVCNGILRNLIRKKEELVWPDPETEPEKAFSIRNSVPEWLGRSLIKEYGAEEAEKIASFRREETDMTLRMNPLKTDDAGFRALLEKKIWSKKEGLLPHTWRVSGAMDIARDADYLAGNFSIQSESSMMACLAMNVKRGMRVLDCCAAPGGKTCCLAEMMGGTGRIQAWDKHEHRVALIEAQAKRLGLEENVRPMVRDATKRREDLFRTMDAVLLDAPCSGLGVMAEKPDIKLRVTEESVRELTALQAKLLDTVCEYVREGGTLVYSTCSVLREENRDQTDAFLARHSEFELLPLPETVPESFREREERGLQLLEHRDGTEGFYICRMRRKA